MNRSHGFSINFFRVICVSGILAFPNRVNADNCKPLKDGGVEAPISDYDLDKAEGSAFEKICPEYKRANYTLGNSYEGGDPETDSKIYCDLVTANSRPDAPFVVLDDLLEFVNTVNVSYGTDPRYPNRDSLFGTCEKLDLSKLMREAFKKHPGKEDRIYSSFYRVWEDKEMSYSLLVKTAGLQMDTYWVAEANNTLGSAELGRQDYAQAIKHFERAIQAYANSCNLDEAAKISEQLGDFESKWGLFDQAVSRYEQAIEFHEKMHGRGKCISKGTNGYLFYKIERILSDQLKDYDSEIGLFRRMANDGYDDPGSSLKKIVGIMLGIKGGCESVTRELSDYLNGDHENQRGFAEDLNFAGDAYLKCGNKAESILCYQNAIKILGGLLKTEASIDKRKLIQEIIVELKVKIDKANSIGAH